MLDLIFFRTAISLIFFGFMIFFVDLFRPHGIDIQAGEQKLLVLAYCTYHNTAMTWLQHRLAPAMQEHHAVIIIPSGIATTHTSFSLWLHMVPWTLQNKAIFKIKLYSKMFPGFTFGQANKSSNPDSFSAFFWIKYIEFSETFAVFFFEIISQICR